MEDKYAGSKSESLGDEEESSMNRRHISLSESKLSSSSRGTSSAIGENDRGDRDSEEEEEEDQHMIFTAASDPSSIQKTDQIRFPYAKLDPSSQGKGKVSEVKRVICVCICIRLYLWIYIFTIIDGSFILPLPTLLFSSCDGLYI